MKCENKFDTEINGKPVTICVPTNEEIATERARLKSRFDQLVQIWIEAGNEVKAAQAGSATFASWSEIAHHALKAAQGYKRKYDLITLSPEDEDCIPSEE